MNSFRMIYLLLLRAMMQMAVDVAESSEIVFRTQTPQLVVLGSYRTLNCSFDIREEAGRVRVNWWVSNSQNSGCQGLKFSTSLANQIPDKEDEEKVLQRTGFTWSTLSLRYATTNDSGWYYCQVVVEIPDFFHSCSGGTRVNITSSLTTTASTRITAKQTVTPSASPAVRHLSVHWWVWGAVGVGALLLIVMLVGVCMQCRSKVHPPKENPIYENMRSAGTSRIPGQPSPRPKSLPSLSNLSVKGFHLGFELIFGETFEQVRATGRSESGRSLYPDAGISRPLRVRRRYSRISPLKECRDGFPLGLWKRP
ncbi:hypothetical protein GJAV_G00073030 [Gymnothorax javanicus]|nr:hypothetical protein GJAV_G00073030 [Gymnothorax javanicus]